jgi:hypothetical protein
MGTTTHSFADRMLELLDRAQVEMDELRVQIALGKMDAADAFEKLKEDYRPIFDHAVQVVQQSREMLGSRAERILPSLEQIRLQLALGRAEAADAFATQKKKLVDAIHAAEQFVSWEEIENPITGRPLRHEFERLRLHLELLRLQFELKRIDSEEEWKNRVVGVVEHWKSKINEHRKEWDNRSEVVMGEMQKAYEHLRTALGQI